jgi:hypothetical protein
MPEALKADPAVHAGLRSFHSATHQSQSPPAAGSLQATISVSKQITAAAAAGLPALTSLATSHARFLGKHGELHAGMDAVNVSQLVHEAARTWGRQRDSQKLPAGLNSGLSSILCEQLVQLLPALCELSGAACASMHPRQHATAAWGLTRLAYGDWLSTAGFRQHSLESVPSDQTYQPGEQ